MTEEGDIGFSAYYVERNGEKVDLMTNERIQSHLMMEEGEILCIRPVLCKLNRFPFFLEFPNDCADKNCLNFLLCRRPGI